MVEYIKRKAAEDAVRLHWLDRSRTIEVIKSIPAVDVAPVRHGRWKYKEKTMDALSQVKCTNCGWWTLDPSVDGVYHYCPNCGAKMDGGS